MGQARWTALLLALALWVSPGLAADPAAVLPDQAITIPVRGAVTESFYLSVPATPPTAILILFPGGGGAIEVREPVPPAEKAGNFLTRSRRLLAGHGFVVATLDAPSDSEEGMVEDFQVSATHAEDVRAVAAWLKARYPVSVWLVGTSRGSLSAANGALRLGSDIDGLVLTSSVTRASRQGPHSLMMMDLGTITQPTLAVSHRADGCSRSPAIDGPRLAEKIGASRKAFVELTGGAEPQSPPCEGRSHHGFIGQEDEAVRLVTDFILGRR
jgi:pimeloyl-ACP methyl ester carboxylesterase